MGMRGYQGTSRRIGDADRQAAFDVLTHAMALGYLDMEEYSERSARCMAARFSDDLAVLIADLPGLSHGAPTASRPADPHRRKWTAGAITMVVIGALGIAVSFDYETVGETLSSMVLAAALIGIGFAFRAPRLWRKRAIFIVAFGVMGLGMSLFEPGDTAGSRIGGAIFACVVIAIGWALRRRKDELPQPIPPPASW